MRAQRELGRRAGIGVLATSVVRDGGDAALSKVLVDRATMAGVDGHVFLDPGRNWVIHGGLAGSCASRAARTRLPGSSAPSSATTSGPMRRT